LAKPSHQRGTEPIPICWSKDEQTINLDGLQCVAVGWGRTSMEGPLQKKPQQVQLEVTTMDECRLAYANFAVDIMDEHHICAGNKKASSKSSGSTCIVSSTYDDINYLL